MKMSFYLKCFLLCMMVGISGCLESSFQLSGESRLPRWFVIPDNVGRDSLSLKMDLYSTFSGGKAVFKLYKEGKFIHIEKYVITSDDQPKIRSVQVGSPSGGSPSGYPRYKVVTINGVTDIIELRKMEPVFYMTDDPAVWEALGVERREKGTEGIHISQ